MESSNNSSIGKGIAVTVMLLLLGLVQYLDSFYIPLAQWMFMYSLCVVIVTAVMAGLYILTRVVIKGLNNYTVNIIQISAVIMISFGVLALITGIITLVQNMMYSYL